MFRIPNIDSLSFWIGAILASVFWWILFAIRPLFQQIMDGFKVAQDEARQRADTTVEDTYRKLIYRRTQETHIASSLFALDEIAEPPLLLAPPIQVEPGMPPYHEYTISRALPYLPTWPEIASAYRAPALSLTDAFSAGTNLAILGQPGAGKTTALAWLTAHVARRSTDTSAFNEKIPFFLHVADLNLPLADPKKPEDLLRPISDHIGEYAPVFALASIPNLVKYAFQNDSALLMLDGLDELPQNLAQEAINYLRLLLRAYPKTRVVVSASPEFTDGLAGMGFSPLSLMPWNSDQQTSFLQKWGRLWSENIAGQPWAQQAGAGEVDFALLNRWLANDNLGLTPLEFTLKIWGAYAGDLRGPRPVDALEAHIRRLTPDQTPADALYALGLQSVSEALVIFDQHRAKEWLKNFEITDASPEEPALENAPAEVSEPGNKKEKKAAPRSGLLGKFTQSGLLSGHLGNRGRFSHPVFASYLAARAMRANDAEKIIQQPTWSGLTQTLRYFAALGDAGPIVQQLLAQEDFILHRPELTAARLLRDAPRNAAWRGMVMTRLLAMLQNEELPVGVRGQAMAAVALSGDPGAGPLFRQLMPSLSAEIRRLAALGAGVLRDAKATETLTNVAMNTPGPGGAAACQALVEIGSAAALEAVAVALLRGDEDLRIAAAEALANHPFEGQETLREAVSSQDILLRRAAVYGLARVGQPWATELIAKVQVEDEQWVVRNAAVELTSAIQRPSPHLPRPLGIPHEMPWLIEFAGKYGMGVTPGQPATDLFLLALKENNPELQLAALRYLRPTPTDGVISGLYHAYYGPDLELREAIYQLLAEFGMSGIRLPSPRQFGLG